MLKVYNSKVLHETLRNFKLYECEICKNNGVWQGKVLRLQVDHIDGNSSNNELSNLRYICPNCHTQTETFTGKNAKSKRFVKPSREEFIELYRQNTIKEISLLKAVSLRVVYQWFKAYIKENKPTTEIKRKLTCENVLEIKASKEPSRIFGEKFSVSSKLIRTIRRNELYCNCN